MNAGQNNSSRMIQNILIAAGIGILVGITIGLINTAIPGFIPQTFVMGSVGAAIGASFAFLHFRKSN
jgi:hypothetical protein